MNIPTLVSLMGTEYVAKISMAENENEFDVAKKYHITVETVREIRKYVQRKRAYSKRNMYFYKNRNHQKQTARKHDLALEANLQALADKFNAR